MNFKAEIVLIKDIEQVSPTFKKRNFVVKYEETPMYPQFVEMQMLQERVAELDKVKPGDHVEIFFNIKGREWKSPTGEIKYFNSLDAWKISRENQSTTSAPAISTPTVTDNDPPF